MKILNNRFWLVIIGFSILAIVLKSLPSLDKKEYYFDRTIEKNILDVLPVYGVDAEKGSFLSAASQGDVLQIDRVAKNIEIISRQQREKFPIPFDYENLVDVRNDTLVFSNFNSWIVYEPITNYVEKIELKDVILFNTFLLDDYGQFLFFGEYKLNDLIQTGFFTYNRKTQQVQKVHVFEEKKERDLKNKLAFKGGFSSNSDYILFSCELVSKVFVFDAKAFYLGTVNTLDKVPFPKIQDHDGVYTYSNEGTAYSNKGSFAVGDTLFVLSANTKEPYLLADLYSLSNQKYLYSQKVDGTGFVNQHIDVVNQKDDQLFFYMFDRSLRIFAIKSQQ